VASLRLLRYAGGALKNLRKINSILWDLQNEGREANFMTSVSMVEGLMLLRRTPE